MIQFEKLIDPDIAVTLKPSGLIKNIRAFSPGRRRFDMKQQSPAMATMPWHVFEVIAGGRNLEQLVKDVRRNGPVSTPPSSRARFIEALGIRQKEGAENVVVIGCASLTSPETTRPAFHLLDTLRIDYTLLEKEYCCGAPLIGYQLGRGENRSKADLAAKEFVGMNIDQARKTGAKRILYLCSWCVYVSRRFYSDCDAEQLYYLDILNKPMHQASLRLSQPTGIAYFPGCHLRRLVYAPEGKWDINWSNYRMWLDRIDGLSVVDIPKYCCQIAPDAIFQQAQKYNMSTLVTPCKACHSTLQRKAPQGMQVEHINDLLLKALKK